MITKFEENKFYVTTPPGEQWGDFEGPFDNQEDAEDHLCLFINKDYSFSPEMLHMAVVKFENDVLDLVKINGVPLNGDYIYRRLKEIA